MDDRDLLSVYINISCNAVGLIVRFRIKCKKITGAETTIKIKHLI